MRTEYWRKYEINGHALDVIDTESKAYMLGFIAADGHVDENGLNFTLHKQDTDILVEIQKVLGSAHPIKTLARNRVSLEMGSRILARRLIALGLESPKTFTVKPPTEVPQELLPHWLRGYWDGDGWLTAQTRASGIVPRIGIAGWSEALMRFVHRLCCEYAHAEIAIGTSKGGWTVSLCSDHARTWLGRVYVGTSIGLERKMHKAAMLYNLKPLSLSDAQTKRRKREYHKWYAARNAEICGLRLQGWTLAQLSGRYGLKPPRLSTICSKGNEHE
jgi:hypothetical protein